MRPNLDRAFDALGPLLADRTFVLGGDLNLSRNYDTVYGTTHHTEFLDGLAARGCFDCMRKFHAEEQQTFWRKGMTTVYQDDHVFVSPDLATRVVSRWSPADRPSETTSLPVPEPHGAQHA